MNIIPGVIRRRYRARGHGVHSPFAFAFINDVLRDHRGYAYYSYALIDRMSASSRERKLAALLVRLVARIPGGVGEMTAANRDAVPLPAGLPLEGARRLLIVNGLDSSIVRAAHDAVSGLQGDVVVVTGDFRELAGALSGSMTGGMSFTSGQGLTVIVADSSLPLAHFNLAFA